MAKSLKDPVRLPCGVTLPNRLVKAAMAEGMSKKQIPGEKFEKAYKAWGDGGWGGILTGNVQIDERWLGLPNDLAFVKLDDPAVKEQWRRYAAACQSAGTPGIVQVCHTGRQSPLFSGSRSVFEGTVAPSPIPLKLGDNMIAKAARAVIFGTPREMTVAEINDLVRRYADAAEFLADVGFAGIELHGAHGYLLSLFLSSAFNHRQDDYGGSPANRARIVLEIIKAIRAKVPASFVVCIKMNSVDLQQSGDLEASMEQIQLLVDAGIDFLEISGGTYEDPKMVGHGERVVSTRTAAREAFFLDFAKVVRERFPDLILMVTGGFRTLDGMKAALAENACDLVGIGRPSVVKPDWANELLKEEKKNGSSELTLAPVDPGRLINLIPVKSIGAGIESKYYSSEINKMGKGMATRPPLGTIKAKA